jgi:hypothetical protein
MSLEINKTELTIMGIRFDNTKEVLRLKERAEELREDANAHTKTTNP